MKKIKSILLPLILIPSFAFAQYGNFESKMTGLTMKIITVVIPALSILGLVYCAILGLNGSAEAKQKAGVVIICSIFGFLAPVIIKFLQNSAGF